MPGLGLGSRQCLGRANPAADPSMTLIGSRVRVRARVRFKFGVSSTGTTVGVRVRIRFRVRARVRVGDRLRVSHQGQC